MADPNEPASAKPGSQEIQPRPRPVVEFAKKTDIVPLQRGAGAVPPPKPNAPSEKKPEGDFRDAAREIVETIVFVVVLVLLLKTFLAEAFIIPTGSMAVTLLGYHKEATCDKCGKTFLVNFSKEVDPQIPNHFEPVFGCICENCYAPNVFDRRDIRE